MNEVTCHCGIVTSVSDVNITIAFGTSNAQHCKYTSVKSMNEVTCHCDIVTSVSDVNITIAFWHSNCTTLHMCQREVDG